MNNESDLPLGESIIMPKEDYELMESDLNYWVAAATMLSELLAANEIEHEISEEAIAEYLTRKLAETT